MADDPKKRGAADRRTVAGGQAHEVRYLANKFDITQAQARELVKEHGNNRAKLEAAAKNLAKR